MLIDTSSPQSIDQHQSEEEFKLLNQITRINKHLHQKVSHEESSQHDKLSIKGHQNEFFLLKKLGFDTQKQGASIYNTNMEYFSEISGEDNEDDSLFDTPNNFLAHPSHHQKDKKLGSNYSSKDLDKIATSSRVCRKGGRIENSQDYFHQNHKLRKQIDYAYKKDVKDNQRMGLPPKYSKFSQRKKSLTPQNNQHKRQSTSNLRKNEAGQEYLQIKVSSRPKYIQKEQILESKQIFENDPNHFQFHTFKIDDNNENSSQNEFLDKNMMKQGKKRQNLPDKTSLQCTFKPKILKKSEMMVKSTKSFVERLSTNDKISKQQKKPYQQQNRQSLNRDRLEQLSQPRRLKTQYEQKSQQIPSFKPSLSKKSLEQMTNCRYDVATRNQLWQKQREQKLQKLRQEQQKQKQRKQNCTYAPSLCQYKGQNAPNLSKFGREGISNYFERVSVANKGTKDQYSKQNRQNEMNISKQTYNSKSFKKQKYTDAVKQLHNRIMNLKI